MFAHKRQNEIFESIKKFGAVTTADLVKEFNVSVETIRRDLLYMEQQGLLKRVHGGAVENQNMKHFATLDVRNEEFSEEKRMLSQNAIKFIEEKDIICVDTGSTANCFARVLKENFSELTVVTNSLDVFNILSNHKDFKLILCGGHFLREENGFYGGLVLDALSKIHVQKAFIFPSAVSIEFGICDYQEEFYQVQKQMLKCADEVFVLADSSKFEKSALLKLDDLKSEYFYVTDDKLSIGLENLY
ncbi:MAG: DeoR/GlpR transcriptional regulator, partial [Clostridia bacterium]|nr:DeoR/GlpR transcriptional regulator [Clostridia bacterium]